MLRSLVIGLDFRVSFNLPRLCKYAVEFSASFFFGEQAANALCGAVKDVDKYRPKPRPLMHQLDLADLRQLIHVDRQMLDRMFFLGRFQSGRLGQALCPRNSSPRSTAFLPRRPTHIADDIWSHRGPSALEIDRQKARPSHEPFFCRFFWKPGTHAGSWKMRTCVVVLHRASCAGGSSQR